MPVEGYIKKKQNEFSSNTTETNRAVDKPSNFKTVIIELVNRVREKIIEKYTTDDMNNSSKLDIITKDALNMIEEESAHIPGATLLDSREKGHILEKLLNNMYGYGVIDPLIKDPSITEIMVNGLNNIFIEKDGKIVIATNEDGENLAFDTPEELVYVVDKIVAPINRKIDDSNPICDARLPNGFRVNIVLNTISLDGTVITIRKFPDKPFTMDRLVSIGALPQEVADFLQKLVKARYNMFVSGGTGSGKTTFLNALSNFINKDERVITIEDAAELKIQGVKNLIRLETRPPNVEGKGAITMRDLLKSALRMRPDRIVVGEVRTGEALEMIQAMNTGHDGSLSTGHANSAADMLARLETMVLMSGMDLPLISIRQQIATAIEIIIHLGKLRDGSRKVLQISEIIGIDQSGNYITSDLFKFDSAINKLTYTGNKLKKTEKLKFAANSKSNGELGRAVIASAFVFSKNSHNNSGISEERGENTSNQSLGLFERFLKTKALMEQMSKSSGTNNTKDSLSSQANILRQQFRDQTYQDGSTTPGKIPNVQSNSVNRLPSTSNEPLHKVPNQQISSCTTEYNDRSSVLPYQQSDDHELENDVKDYKPGAFEELENYENRTVNSNQQSNNGHRVIDNSSIDIGNPNISAKESDSSDDDSSTTGTMFNIRKRIQ